MAKSNGLSRKIIKLLRLPFIFTYKLRGMNIGLTSSFPLFTTIENPNRISIGKGTNVDKRTIFRCFGSSKNKQIIIGDNCSLGNDLKILSCDAAVTIKNNCTIAGNVLITSENHGNNPMTKSFNDNPLIGKEVIIGEGVWIGEKSIILPGVTIGEKAIIGAGSVVTKDIPEYSIAVGNPCKVIKKWNFDLKKYEGIETE